MINQKPQIEPGDLVRFSCYSNAGTLTYGVATVDGYLECSNDRFLSHEVAKSSLGLYLGPAATRKDVGIILVDEHRLYVNIQDFEKI